MGNKPKPIEMRILEGNPGHRPIKRNRPKYNPANTSPTRGMSYYEKKIWKYLVDRLYPNGVLKEPDILMFEAWVKTFAKWRETERKARDYTPSAENGFKPNPYARQALQYLRECRLLPRPVCGQSSLPTSGSSARQRSSSTFWLSRGQGPLF